MHPSLQYSIHPTNSSFHRGYNVCSFIVYYDKGNMLRARPYEELAMEDEQMENIIEVKNLLK
ncbi:hypothetical protein ACA29_07200 [Lederbergia galactosidilytica]|uniref:Uncharacterized protein n=1 Tax=Lederbergia galactosidilytica TaxID=217031 RepID=A0A0Q9YCC2_9BACI|nr:hypothetical protein ACA29_07200 [Lederbergia galactosidilytica]